MTTISLLQLGNAVLRVERMSFHERELLADEIHAAQPGLFYSVLTLQHFGATLQEMEVVLNLLFVFYSAMKMSGTVWPVISEDVQELSLKRINARARFIEGLTPLQQEQATVGFIADHTQTQLLAYAFGKLTEHELNTVKTEAEKMIVLVALNLFECIALTAPMKTKGPKR
ncbi:MAG: hypothetical protein H7255_07600 [Ramlibacter sp.]|nr:hypothetical protein [Ramlibacter sp.]